MFCDLAETERFTKAAQINGVTESAVSQTISALERQFKALLIERSRKNFRLTAEGEVFYEYSKRMLQSYGTMQSKIQGIKGVLAGNIHVVTVYSIGLYELPPYAKRFMKDYLDRSLHACLGGGFGVYGLDGLFYISPVTHKI